MILKLTATPAVAPPTVGTIHAEVACGLDACCAGQKIHAAAALTASTPAPTKKPDAMLTSRV